MTGTVQPVYLLTRSQLIELGLSEATIGNLSSINIDLQSLKTVVNAITPSPPSTEPRSETEVYSTRVNMTDLPEPPFKRIKQEREEPDVSLVSMNDLPECLFEKILSCLSLEDQIKSRAVLRKWCKMIDSFRPKSLFFSEIPIGFIQRRSLLIAGVFAQNFIYSPRFESFFQTFGQSIFSSLKRLRLFNLHLNAKNMCAFLQEINSFGQLEELGLFRFNLHAGFDSRADFKLNLPMLKSIRLDDVGTAKLTLNAPRLKSVRHLDKRCSLTLDLVHGESVEKLTIKDIRLLKTKNLKNLKYLYCGFESKVDLALSGLEKLKEIHLQCPADVSNFFRQKERNGRANLKIFLSGVLLNGSGDPAIDSFTADRYKRYLHYLAEHLPRVADEIPLRYRFQYSTIELVALESQLTVLSRFIDLECIQVDRLVQDVGCFLELLQNLDNIGRLTFYCDQSQTLFDRLPDYRALNSLLIFRAPKNLDFLFRLKSLVSLELRFTIDIRFIRNVLERIPFLCYFQFKHASEWIAISIDSSKLFKIKLDGRETTFSDLNAAIRFIGNGTE